MIPNLKIPMACFGLTLMTLVACVSSKKTAPVREQATEGKATRAESPFAPRSVELRVLSEVGARDMERAVILNPQIQNCIRQGIDANDSGFAVAIAGVGGTDGHVTDIRITSGPTALERCLTGAMETLKVPYGVKGEFRVTVRRAEWAQEGGQTFRLELDQFKKFE